MSVEVNVRKFSDFLLDVFCFVSDKKTLALHFKDIVVVTRTGFSFKCDNGVF